jgi:hypothetical protein
MIGGPSRQRRKRNGEEKGCGAVGLRARLGLEAVQADEEGEKNGRRGELG